MTENVMTTGFVIYRIISEGEVEILGICQTKEKAQADVDALYIPGHPEWKFKAAPFIGWGQVAPGVFSQNGPAPLKIVPR